MTLTPVLRQPADPKSTALGYKRRAETGSGGAHLVLQEAEAGGTPGV